MIQPVKLRRLLLAATALTLATPALAAPAPQANGWGVPMTDVEPDREVILGRLSNGMKYAIRRNATPKGAGSLRLHFAFGSLGEADNERGLAHFIEHMAFNGSTRVPEGDMIKILQREGLAFGPDTNAATGFDGTTYMLDLPVADKRRLDTGFLLMREVASEVKFDPEAVNRERGVILGERRSRDSFQLRQLIDELEFTLPQTPYPNRLPIGTPQVLQTAPAERLKALYHRYYRPENATLVFVGDADPKDIEARIKAGFDDWEGVGPAGAKLPRGKVDLARPLGVDTFRNVNVPTTVELTVLRAWEDPADTRAERRRGLVETLGTAIFNRRLTKLANAADSQLLSSGMNGGGFRDAALLQSVSVRAKDGAWKAALGTVEQELRRALTHGFTDAELAREKANLSASMKNAAESQDTRSNQSLAGLLVGNIDDNDHVTRPDWRWAFYQSVEPTITRAEVNAAFAALWKGSAPLIHVSDKQAILPADIAAAWIESTKVAVAAPTASEAARFAYESFGPAGKVVDDRTIADLGIRTVRFANGVRLNMKVTDFEKGRVRYGVRLGGGLLALPKDKPGLSMLMTTLYTMGGTGKQSFEDIKEALSGKLVGIGGQVGEDAVATAGVTSPQDLGIQMKAAAAYLTDPGFRDEAGTRWVNLVPVIDKQLRSDPQSMLRSKVPAALMGGDARFGIPDAPVLQQRSMVEARAAMGTMSPSAPIEIGLVGDFEPAQAIAAVADSFGALATRSDKAPELPGARSFAFAPAKGIQTFTHTGQADQALVAAIWPTTDDGDYRRAVGMQVLSSVVDLMLTDTLREKLGATYGASVGSNMSNVYPKLGTFEISSVVSPRDFQKVEAAIAETIAELRDKPIDDDLLLRARNPLLENIDRSLRENGYWLGYVVQAQGRADRLQRIRDRRAAYQAVTPAELQKLARTYLVPSQLRMVRVVSSRWDPKTGGLPVVVMQMPTIRPPARAATPVVTVPVPPKN